MQYWHIWINSIKPGGRGGEESDHPPAKMMMRKLSLIENCTCNVEIYEFIQSNMDMGWQGTWSPHKNDDEKFNFDWKVNLDDPIQIRVAGNDIRPLQKWWWEILAWWKIGNAILRPKLIRIHWIKPGGRVGGVQRSPSGPSGRQGMPASAACSSWDSLL